MVKKDALGLAGVVDAAKNYWLVTGSQICETGMRVTRTIALADPLLIDI